MLCRRSGSQGANFMSQKLRVIASSKLESKRTLSQKNVEKSLLKLRVKFLQVEFLLTFDSWNCPKEFIRLRLVLNCLPNIFNLVQA